MLGIRRCQKIKGGHKLTREVDYSVQKNSIKCVTGCWGTLREALSQFVSQVPVLASLLMVTLESLSGCSNRSQWGGVRAGGEDEKG